MAIAKITKAQEREIARQHYIETCEPIAIDADERGAYAVVPSENAERTYKVHFAEPRDRASYAVSCECDDFYYRSKRNPAHICKHAEIVTNYHARIHEQVRRRDVPYVGPIIGSPEMDALVEQLEKEFGLVEEAPKKAKKVRRSAPNADLIAQLQVKPGVKIGIKQIRKAFAEAPAASPEAKAA